MWSVGRCWITLGERMTDYEATMICEGVMDPPGVTPEEQEKSYIAAWQQLIDTGLAWNLQGWFGRRAAEMIDLGICREGGQSKDDPRVSDEQE